MEKRDFVKEQMDIVNEKIEVTEGTFAGMILGPIVLRVALIAVAVWL